MNETELTEYFEYSDALRESGKTNMFGVVPYLCVEFGLETKEGSKVLSLWMETFKESKNVSERAEEACIN